MSTRVVVFCSLLSSAATVHSADEIHFTITGPNSVTFNWRGTEDTISYGTERGVYTNTVAVVVPDPEPLPTSSGGPFREARITGLSDNTLYYYVIGAGTDEHTFRTPLPSGSSGFIVYAEGDIGSTLSGSRMSSLQNLIVNDLLTDTDLPRFVLGLGDLTYGETNLSRVDQHFNDVMVWSRDIPYMPIWGNHDWDTLLSIPDQLNNYEGRFDFPHSQTSPGADTAIGNGPGEDWYWFDYGNVRFIAVPEPYIGATWSSWQTAVQPIMDEAQGISAIDFIVTFSHRPAYSSGHHAGATTLKTILDALGGASHNKYVLHINGHSHDYERFFSQHGVVHITAGTGGSTLETDATSCLWRVCPQPPETAFRAMHHGILRLKFSDTGIEGKFICGPAQSAKNDITCNSGDIVDSFSIGTPSVDNIAPSVSITAPVDASTVSGTVTVSATAADNTGGSGVAGVQFKLDGSNLGAEDTSSPYGISWDSASVSNGLHSLTAVARDIAGNKGTSSPISVTVSNTNTVLTFTPNADATIKLGSPTTNFGNSAQLALDASPIVHFLLRFSVSGIDTTHSVQSAKLRLFNIDSSGFGGTFHSLANATQCGLWVEKGTGGVTWNTAPATGASLATLGNVASSNWYEVDITPLITGNGTFCLRVDSSASNNAIYSSKEGTTGFAPQLLVTVH